MEKKRTKPHLYKVIKEAEDILPHKFALHKMKRTLSYDDFVVRNKIHLLEIKTKFEKCNTYTQLCKLKNWMFDKGRTEHKNDLENQYQNQEFQDYTDSAINSFVLNQNETKRSRQQSKITSEDSFEMIMNFDDNPIELSDISSKYKSPEMLALLPRKRSHSNEECKLGTNIIISGNTTSLNELL